MTTKRGIENPAQGEAPKVPRSLRILIADDERDTVLTLMMLLREEGHQVRGVYTGQHVLDAVRGFGEYRNSVDKLLSTVVGFDHYLLKPCNPNQLLALLAPLAGDQKPPAS